MNHLINSKVMPREGIDLNFDGKTEEVKGEMIPYGLT